MESDRAEHSALSIAVSEEFLNGIARAGIGDGLAAAESRQTFNVPFLGLLDIGIVLTIVEVSFEMRERHGDRLLATIRAAGEVKFYGESMMPALPGRAMVRGEVLVRPEIAYRPDGSFVAKLDLASSELVAMTLEGIEGIEADAEAQAQMGQMLFAAIGGELFEGLAANLESPGLELAAERAVVFDELGVAIGEAVIDMGDALMTIGLPAVEGLEGHADATPVQGPRVGVGIAAGGLTALVNRLAAEAVGAPLPFDLDITARDDRVGARVRNLRLVELPMLPDLRPGFRSTIEPRLFDGHLEISLREAWVELPLMPAAVNRVSRWLGGVAAVAPMRVSIPSSTKVPVRPGSDHQLSVAVVEFEVGRDGVDLIVEAHL